MCPCKLDHLTNERLVALSVAENELQLVMRSTTRSARGANLMEEKSKYTPQIVADHRNKQGQETDEDKGPLARKRKSPSKGRMVA